MSKKILFFYERSRHNGPSPLYLHLIFLNFSLSLLAFFPLAMTEMLIVGQTYMTRQGFSACACRVPGPRSRSLFPSSFSFDGQPLMFFVVTSIRPPLLRGLFRGFECRDPVSLRRRVFFSFFFLGVDVVCEVFLTLWYGRIKTAWSVPYSSFTIPFVFFSLRFPLEQWGLTHQILCTLPTKSCPPLPTPYLRSFLRRSDTFSDLSFGV